MLSKYIAELTKTEHNIVGYLLKFIAAHNVYVMKTSSDGYYDLFARRAISCIRFEPRPHEIYYLYTNSVADEVEGFSIRGQVFTSISIVPYETYTTKVPKIIAKIHYDGKNTKKFLSEVETELLKLL